MRNTEPRHVLPGEEIIIRCIIGRHLANPAKVFIYTNVREEVTLQSYQPVSGLDLSTWATSVFCFPHKRYFVGGPSPVTALTYLAVGTPVTRRPLHSPGRAVFPHPVLRSYSLSRKTIQSTQHPSGQPCNNTRFPE
jgi:hypothetical protein